MALVQAKPTDLHLFLGASKSHAKPENKDMVIKATLSQRNKQAIYRV